MFRLWIVIVIWSVASCNLSDDTEDIRIYEEEPYTNFQDTMIVMRNGSATAVFKTTYKGWSVLVNPKYILFRYRHYYNIIDNIDRLPEYYHNRKLGHILFTYTDDLYSVYRWNILYPEEVNDLLIISQGYTLEYDDFLTIFEEFKSNKDKYDSRL